MYKNSYSINETVIYNFHRKQWKKAQKLEEEMLSQQEMMYNTGKYPNMHGDYPQSIHSYSSSRYPQAEMVPLQKMPQNDYPESVGWNFSFKLSVRGI